VFSAKWPLVIHEILVMSCEYPFHNTSTKSSGRVVPTRATCSCPQIGNVCTDTPVLAFKKSDQ
jgi:hypothetical protein